MNHGARFSEEKIKYITTVCPAITIEATSSDAAGTFSNNVDAGDEKGGPITSWVELSKTNIESYTVSLTEDYTKMEARALTGKLQDPTQAGQLVLQVDPENIVFRVDLTIDAYEPSEPGNPDDWFILAVVAAVLIAIIVIAVWIIVKR